MPPGESLAALPKAHKIAAAGRATVGCPADAQQKHGPQRRAIILFAPRCEFLAVTTRAARVLPGIVRPDAGFPTIVTAAAAQRINADQAFEQLTEPTVAGDFNLTRAAFRTGQLHDLFRRDRTAARSYVSLHILSQCILQAAAHRRATVIYFEPRDRNRRQQSTRGRSHQNLIGRFEIGR